ncbi:hypothetical protein ACFQ48_07160 [Hymenobacter caeli]|uniref:Uncharacterized protein n=1 Tax=Hymenobacter caeli TaxID=2735894 RepID=A0ABX2FRF9_9BACT|nr:hypothetical protein [Hymenobacter caeli]NRT18964.1 hypothetical protein [Hymenobacter caeli]
MLRSSAVLLLLLNYLLVVGAGLGERPAHKVDRAFAYVHGKDCQRVNAWRGGMCFDDCNGVQYTVQKNGTHPPLQQLLTSLKGLDAHCLPSAGVALAAPGIRGPARPAAVVVAAVPVGFQGAIYSPPRRG